MKRVNFSLDAATRVVRSEHALEVYERDMEVLHGYKKAFHEDFEQHWNISEIELSADQKRIVREMILSVENFISSLRIGDPKRFMDISPEDVHLYDEGDIEHVMDGKNISGIERFGNIYLRQEQDAGLFAATLSHEMAHTIAYGYLTYIFETARRKEHRDSGNDRFMLVAAEIRKGHITQFRRNEREYVGMHEAVTELIGLQIRKEYYERTRRLRTSDGEKIKREVSYVAQISVLEYILEFISKDDDAFYDLLHSIYKDHVTGSSEFLQVLEPRDEDGNLIIEDAYWVYHGQIMRSSNVPDDAELLSHVLAKMGPSLSSALEVAEKLGAQEIVESIEKQMNDEDINSNEG